MEPKTNFQSQNTESSVPHPLHVKQLLVCVCVWIPQRFLIWPLLQHAVAKTMLPWQFTTFLYLSILISSSYRSSGGLPLPPDSHYYSDLPPHPASCCSLFPVSPAYISVPGAALSASVVPFLTLLGRSRGRGCGTVFIKAAVVYSNVLGLHVISPLSPFLL